MVLILVIEGVGVQRPFVDLGTPLQPMVGCEVAPMHLGMITPSVIVCCLLGTVLSGGDTSPPSFRR